MVKKFAKPVLAIAIAMMSAISGVYWSRSSLYQSGVFKAASSTQATEITNMLNQSAATVAAITGLCIALALIFDE